MCLLDNMRMPTWSRLVTSTALIALSLSLSGPSASARDHGVQGRLYDISETDVFAMIRARIQKIADDGGLEELNNALRDEVVRTVESPTPVAGIRPATEASSRLYDPTIYAEADYRDHVGRVIVAKGTPFNPLDHVPMPGELIFVAGDRPEEVSWAFSRSDTSPVPATIVLVSGRPAEIMRNHSREVFFDQSGILSRQFSVRHSPTVVSQKGRTLLVSEHPVEEPQK